MQKLIVGLGNIGDKYDKSRHNVGFIVLDNLPYLVDSSWVLNKKTSSLEIKKGDYIFAKPYGYMNNSGISVRKLLDFYKISGDNLLVVHDDIDLTFGRLVRKKGSGSAGHNGVSSIIDHCGSNDFWRLRIGVGRPEHKSQVVDYVLGDLTPGEYQMLVHQNFEPYVLF